jgi:hypothetical protein
VALTAFMLVCVTAAGVQLATQRHPLSHIAVLIRDATHCDVPHLTYSTSAYLYIFYIFYTLIL